MSKEVKVDPELRDDEEEGVGDPDAYDHEAVSFVKYEHAQFELPDDYEESDDDE